ncbi:LPXTG cell wall anchor domain-containing protein [Streptomyces sp. NPDC002346]
MSHRPRPTLRTAVLTAVAAGAVLLPSATALASVPSDATPSPSVTSTERTPAPAPEAGSSRPARGEGPSVAPRGGVAAGERPIGTTSNTTTAVAGSVAAAALLGGAGTLVLRRRRATAHRNG